MDIQTLQFFAHYNAAVNKQMNAFIEKLTPAQWNQPFQGFFPSIYSLCNHLYTCDVNWLYRFSRLRSFSSLQGMQSIPFGQNHLADMQDYLQKREATDSAIETFAAEVLPADLSLDLHYVDSANIPYTRNFGFLVLHMFNHQTHHRGMVSVYLEGLHIPNDFSNIYDVI